MCIIIFFLPVIMVPMCPEVRRVSCDVVIYCRDNSYGLEDDEEDDTDR